ncbi:MAG TPA: hypothetical protein VJ242_01720 [Patescibacteria group bacterium]|nr:hypothetical protein [Patescibacteria group bacterium]
MTDIPPLEKNPINKELKPASNWIPMANEGLRAQPHKIHAGAFQWTPNFILYGKQLEINALGLEMLSQKLNISSPVEIEPFHAPKEKETTIIGSVSPKGETTITGMRGRIKKIINPKISYDEETGKIYLPINFSDIADQLENQLPQGGNNPAFFSKYGQRINQVLKTQIKLIPLVESLFSKNKQGLYYESFVTAVSIMPGFLIASGELARIALGKAEGIKEAMTLMPLPVVLFEIGFIMSNIMAMVSRSYGNFQEANEYGDYIKEGLKNLQLSRFFFPERVFKQIIAPVIYAQFTGEDLIRAKPQSDLIR